MGTNNQEAKADAGKLRLTLVPRQIIKGIAKVRMFAVEVKYPQTGEDGWKTIEIERIRDAAFRHFMAYLDNPKGVDEESGISHLAHACTNFAFLYEMEGLDEDIQRNTESNEKRQEITFGGGDDGC